MVYVVPTSAVSGPVSAGAEGTAHCGASTIFTVAVAVPPPADAGSVAVIVTVPGDTPVTLIDPVRLPALIVIGDCTVAIAGLDEVTCTDVLLIMRTSVCTNSDPLFPAVTFCVGGVSEIAGTGKTIAP